MNIKFFVKSLNSLEKLGDALLYFPMLLISSAPLETPQRTNWWNRRELTLDEQSCINRDALVWCKGIGRAPNRYFYFWLPFIGEVKINRSHVPIFGGWRDYVVLRPLTVDKNWYVGWLDGDGTCALSRVKLKGPVRMLIGPKDVQFFGVDAFMYEQCDIALLDEGYIGDNGLYRKFPLL